MASAIRKVSSSLAKVYSYAGSGSSDSFCALVVSKLHNNAGSDKRMMTRNKERHRHVGTTLRFTSQSTCQSNLDGK